MSWGAREKAKVFVEMALAFLRHQLSVFPKLGGKSGMNFLGPEVLPLLWEELGGFFCWECDEPLDLVSTLEESDFSDLCVEVVMVVVSHETSMQCSQYCMSMACTTFWRPGRVVGLSW